MRLLVTGSDLYDNHRAVKVHLEVLARAAGGQEIVVVHNGVLGAQLIAGQIAEASGDAGFVNEPHPGATNQELVDLGADECLGFFQKAFDGSSARDLMARARVAGIFMLGDSD